MEDILVREIKSLLGLENEEHTTEESSGGGRVLGFKDYFLKIKSGRWMKNVKKEYDILVQLKGVDFKYSPEPIKYGVHRDAAYLMMRRIEGECLKGTWLCGGPAERIVEQLKSILSEIKNIKIDCEDVRSYNETFISILKMNDYAYGKSLELKEILDSLDESKQELVLCHGDFWADNIIIKDGDVVGVIDWEFACYMPAEMEFSPRLTPCCEYFGGVWNIGHNRIGAFVNLHRGIIDGKPHVKNIVDSIIRNYKLNAL